jgi:hypothetical protein
MKQLSILTMTMIALSGFVATTVRAQSPHFVGGQTFSLNSATGDYSVTFKEAGLGSTPVTYTLAATEPATTFTYQCFTKSGGQPQGAPNGISPSSSTTVTTITPHNGSVTATITLTPEQDGAHCQGGGLVLRLIAVDWDGVTLNDGLGNTVTVPDACFGSVNCP